MLSSGCFCLDYNRWVSGKYRCSKKSTFQYVWILRFIFQTFNKHRLMNGSDRGMECPREAYFPNRKSNFRINPEWMKFTCKLITTARLSIALMKSSLLHWYFIHNLRDPHRKWISTVFSITSLRFRFQPIVCTSALQEASIYLASTIYFEYHKEHHYITFWCIWTLLRAIKIPFLASFDIDLLVLDFSNVHEFSALKKIHVDRSNFNIHWTKCVNLKQPWTMRRSCQLRSSLEAYKSDPCF